MPQAIDITPADRQQGVATNMHPRLNGDLIQTPDDVLEGLGDFVGTEPDGDPTGWTIGRTPVPDGRNLYVGATADTCTRQNTGNPLPHDRPSSLVDYTIVRGAPVPQADDPGLALIPRPAKVRLKTLPAAGNKGYPQSTPNSPHWYAWARIKKGRIGKMSPAVPFHLDTGQNFRVYLPEEDDETNEIALLMAEPGKSRPSKPGPMYVQRELKLSTHQLPYYDMTGPFRKPNKNYGPGDDETKLEKAKKPDIRVTPGGASRVGRYEARIQWCDDKGDALPGESSKYVYIEKSARHTIKDDEGADAFVAGEGRVKVNRGPAPPAATGWRLWVYIRPTLEPSDYSAGWRKVMNKHSGAGQSVPFGINNDEIELSGWDGSEEHYASNDSIICVQEDLPQVDTSGTPEPDTAPEPPEATGAGRPDPQKWFVRVTDTVDGAESLPSEPAHVTIEENEIFSAVFTQPDNAVPNGAIVEQNPAGDPLYWSVIRTGGYAELGEDTIEFGTFAPVALASPTPEVQTDLAEVDPTVPHYVDVEFDVADAASGTPEGYVAVRVNYWDAAQTFISGEHLTNGTEPGEYEKTITLAATGGTAPTMPANTAYVSIVFILYSGTANKNKRASVRHAAVRKHKHKRRRHRRHHKDRKPRRPTKPQNPTIEDPPDPVRGPEVLATDPPDRPTSPGAVLESVSTAASPPSASYAETENNATISSSAAAGLLGAPNGLLVSKTNTAAVGNATTHRGFSPTNTAYPFRHELGFYTRNRVSIMPSDGRLVMHPILSGTERKAWVEFSASREVDTLTVTDDALQAGTVYISVNGTEYPVAVPGTAEVKEVTVGTNPTGAGDVSVTLDGVRTSFAQGGTNQEFTWSMSSRPNRSGTFYLVVNGTSYAFRTSNNEQMGRIVDRVMATGFPGYTLTRSTVNQSITFKANGPGLRPTPTLNTNSTGIGGGISIATNGTNETREALAARIRATNFAGYVTSQGTAGAHVIRFTATGAGDRPDALVTSGTTGAALTVATITQGSVAGKAALAASIRGLLATGWTITGTGNQAIFTATTNGSRVAPRYRSNNTGAEATFERTVIGATAILTAHAKDSLGNTYQKKILQSILTTDVLDVDVTIAGAGTDRAVATFWASKAGATMAHCARFEDLDLTGQPVTNAHIGVAEQTGSTSAYELQISIPQFTDRGKTYHRDHDALGNWLPQIFSYTAATQPVRQDLLLQDMEFAVIPGQQYALSLYGRATVIETLVPARLLCAYAHRPGPKGRGLKQYLGDVSGDTLGTTGLTGTNAWAQRTIVYTAPADCHKVSVASRDIGAAEIVLQEVVNTPGTTPKRTRLYKTSGSYVATHDTRTPGARNSSTFWTRKRKAITAIADAADTTAAVAVTYKAADPSAADTTIPGTFTAAQTDPALVPDKAFVQTIFAASSNGLVTAAIKSGAPRIEYALNVGVRPMSTLLDPYGRELPGGSAFAKLNEWSSRRPETRRRLPSGRLYDAPTLFDPVGHLPACELLVFSYEAKRYVEENWREPLMHEHFGLDLLTLKLAEQPEFDRETITVETDGKRGRYAIWKAKLAPSEVISAVRMA